MHILAHNDALHKIEAEAVLLVQYPVQEPNHLFFDLHELPVVLESVQKRRPSKNWIVIASFGQLDPHMVGQFVNSVQVSLQKIRLGLHHVLVLNEECLIFEDQLHEFVVNFKAFLDPGVV